MCAIAGLLVPPDQSVDTHVLGMMLRMQAHRGPDGEGYALLSYQPGGSRCIVGSVANIRQDNSGQYCVGFAHRRLAIIDLSEAGRQPMASLDGRDWITYNGEIYNFVELRDELRGLGHRFRSESDTEVLLASYRQWGLGCLERLNGMFAFALWDGEQRQLVCARDRMGEKPFYYVGDGIRFAFASELKGLLPVVQAPTVNQRLAYAYLDGGRLDFDNQTFVEQIRQLEPGHYVVIRDGQITRGRYWKLPTDLEESAASPEDVRERFRELFYDAVRIRLRSDVGVGSCLSGGLDSSAIVCVTNELLSRLQEGPSHLVACKQKTFSACFAQPRFDERRYIQEVVRACRVDPQYTIPDPKELATILDRLVWHHDEPFGSTSIFAQWTVMRLVSECGIKVVLDGQGADESLGGYHGFFGAYFADLLRQGVWRKLLREWCAYRRRHGSPSVQLLGNLVRPFASSSFLHAMRRAITGNRKWMNAEFSRRWRLLEETDEMGCSAFLGMQHRLLTRNGLRALLHSEDRSSMAFGVEARLPFLDHRLVEFLYGLNGGWKLHEGWTKMLLRQSMEGILPPAIQWRPDKIGFATPEDEWFRVELREVFEDCLADSRTKERGYLHLQGARKVWEAHLSGRCNVSTILWRWLNLELWCRQFLDRQSCFESWS